MKACIKCGKELPEEAIYCFICGKKQITQKNTSHKKRANGEGCVYKRGDKWEAVTTIGTYANGNPRRRHKGGFKTKKEALLYLEKSKYKPIRQITLEALYNAIQPHIEKLSKDKQFHYNLAWNRLSVLHRANVPDLTVEDLQKVVTDNAPGKYPAKDMRDLLSLIFERAIADDYVTTNKAKYIVLPEADEKETVPFTAEEITALWNDYYDGHRETGYFLLMIYTGMMPGELLKMRVFNIDVDKKRIIGAGIKTDKRKETPIILPEVIIPVVNELIAGKETNDKLFKHDPKRIYKFFDEIKIRAGLRQIPQLRPYSCRHTTATTLADKNVSSAILKEIMRHSKITTTQRYIHSDQKIYEQKMNEVFTDPTQK